MIALRIAFGITSIQFATILTTLPSLAASGSPPGAASCSGCHAARATTTSPVPKLNGRDANEILTAMAAFRDGARPATVMNRIAKGFSDDELRPIAAWLATKK